MYFVDHSPTRFRTAACRTAIIGTPCAAAGVFLSMFPLVRHLRELAVPLPFGLEDALLVFTMAAGSLASFFVPAAAAVMLADDRTPWRFTGATLYAIAGLLTYFAIWLVAMLAIG